MGLHESFPEMVNALLCDKECVFMIASSPYFDSVSGDPML